MHEYMETGRVKLTFWPLKAHLGSLYQTNKGLKRPNLSKLNHKLKSTLIVLNF